MIQKRRDLHLRKQQVEADIRAEFHVLHNTTEGRGLQLQTLIPAVGAGQVDPRPDALHGASRRVQRELRAVGIGADQSARTQQNASEIARDHAGHIVYFFALQNLQNRHPGRPARLAVIGKARWAVLDNVCIDIV